MNLWDKVTGNDMTRELKAYKERSRQLPSDYQTAWEAIQTNLWQHADFTGRNLMPILDGVLGLLEESAANSLSVKEVLGDDIESFYSTLASEEGAKSFRDKWRDQLNRNIARRLGK